MFGKCKPNSIWLFSLFLVLGLWLPLPGGHFCWAQKIVGRSRPSTQSDKPDPSIEQSQTDQNKKPRPTPRKKKKPTKAKTIETVAPTPKSDTQLKSSVNPAPESTPEDIEKASKAVTTSDSQVTLDKTKKKDLIPKSYFFGPKVGFSFFNLESQVNSGPDLSSLSGIANVIGLTQILKLKKLEIQVDLAFLSSRLSYPEAFNVPDSNGMLASGFQGLFGINYFIKGNEAFFIFQAGVTSLSLNHQGSIARSEKIQISPASTLPHINLGVGMKLYEKFQLCGTIAQYVSQLPGSSLAEVSLYYLF